MRVTENMTKSLYLRNHNRTQTNLIKSYTRIMTQRRFNRVSEDTVNGNLAMTLRRQQRNLAIYNKNLNTAKELFNAAESNLNMVAHDCYISVEEQLTAAVNGTYSQNELDVFAQTLEQTAEAMVNALNGDFGERQIFGGTNDTSAPFRIERVVMTSDEDVELYSDGETVLSKEQLELLSDEEQANFNKIEASGKKIAYPPNWQDYYEYSENGSVKIKDGVTHDDLPKTVLYNGVPVSFDAVGNKDVKAGMYDVVTIDVGKSGNIEYKHNEYELSEDSLKYARTKNDNSYIFPGSKPIYVDIGIGVRYDNKYEVDPQTVLDTSLNGAAITGSGIDITPDGTIFSKNLIQIVLDSAAALRKGDQSYANAAIDRANEANGKVLTAITTLGNKQNDIEFYESRNATYLYNLNERQNLIEGTDMEDEISNWYNLQAAYDAFLKIGTSVIPRSVFDFV